MPGQLFTDAERRRLGGFPALVSHEDLVTYYTLTRSDRAQVNQYADEASRLGFALQLATLRYLGFCPDDLGSAPSEVVRFLADQLKIAPGSLSAYGRRAQTRTDHFLAVQDHLGYRKAHRRGHRPVRPLPGPRVCPGRAEAGGVPPRQ